MKCHAGVEFPAGSDCPKCKATLGEVCWPGINADLLELPKLRQQVEYMRTLLHNAVHEYPVASGLYVDTDGQAGYGSLKAMRLHLGIKPENKKLSETS